MAKALDWNQALDGLWARGYGRLGTLLSKRQCEEARALYQNTDLFRSRIDMARYRFGRGEYQYFANPLPAPVEKLRHELYGQLATTAKEWMQALGLPQDYPLELDDFLKRCPQRASSGLRPCCSITLPAILTASTRISTARSFFRSRS